MTPPPVDLIIMRDVLFHLPPRVTIAVLRKIKQSGARFLLTTTFRDACNTYATYSEGMGFRSYFGLNLERPPYKFPDAEYWIFEKIAKRHMGLFEISKLPDYEDFEDKGSWPCGTGLAGEGPHEETQDG